MIWFYGHSIIWHDTSDTCNKCDTCDTYDTYHVYDNMICTMHSYASDMDDIVIDLIR